MNFVYLSSCVFTHTSTRVWIVTDFGCLGGALMIAMFSPCSSFAVCLTSLKLLIPFFLLGQNISCVFGPTSTARLLRPRLVPLRQLEPEVKGNVTSLEQVGELERGCLARAMQ